MKTLSSELKTWLKNNEYEENNLNKVSDPFSFQITSRKFKLSSREIQICNFIKAGCLAGFLILEIYTVPPFK